MDLGAAAAVVTAPVLAVCGTADTVVSPTASAQLVAGSPDRTLVEIDGADHIFNVLSHCSAADQLLTVTTNWLVATLTW